MRFAQKGKGTHWVVIQAGFETHLTSKGLKVKKDTEP